MSDGAVPIEDFIHAITTQLDRVQDALRLKAVNRPLTYALKDMSMELHVFVEVDSEGIVRFRTSAPNESGASVINLGFTTITKPMIEENTVSLSAVRSSSLQELGLKPDEQRRLEQLGVYNVSQLNRLESNAGAKAIARLSDVPMDRLREILVRARPQVRQVVAAPKGSPPRQSAPPRPATPPIPSTPPGPNAPSKPMTPPASPPRAPGGPIAIAPGARRVALIGRHLTADGGMPDVEIDSRPMAVVAGADDELLVDLPEGFEGGALEVRHVNGDTQSFELRVEETPDAIEEPQSEWAPVGG